jgi:hypothetical protein
MYRQHAVRKVCGGGQMQAGGLHFVSPSFCIIPKIFPSVPAAWASHPMRGIGIVVTATVPPADKSTCSITGIFVNAQGFLPGRNPSPHISCRDDS